MSHSASRKQTKYRHEIADDDYLDKELDKIEQQNNQKQKRDQALDDPIVRNRLMANTTAGIPVSSNIDDMFVQQEGPARRHTVQVGKAQQDANIVTSSDMQRKSQLVLVMNKTNSQDMIKGQAFSARY